MHGSNGRSRFALPVFANGFVGYEKETQSYAESAGSLSVCHS
jgi:hypothetical protein